MLASNDDVGKNVMYYDEGWRCGTLDEIKGKFAIIQPLMSKWSSTKRATVKIEIKETTKDGMEIECVKRIEVND